MSDTSRWLEWMGIREVKVERPSANGLLGPGSVYTVRGLATDRYEVVDYDPPHRMSYRMLDGSLPARDYRAHLTLRPVQNGTALAWRVSFALQSRAAVRCSRGSLAGFSAGRCATSPPDRERGESMDKPVTCGERHFRDVPPESRVAGS